MAKDGLPGQEVHGACTFSARRAANVGCRFNQSNSCTVVSRDRAHEFVGAQIKSYRTSWGLEPGLAALNNDKTIKLNIYIHMY